ncbi:ATP-grasp domain-containing protein [Allorhizobium undicola]|uniref:ATP-grasp domain-containing protein n=1 Tax=Allorhizobium undicola TaxID=78527 RepID=UPI003D354550
MRILVMTVHMPFYKPVNNYYIPRSLRDMGHDVYLGDVNTLVILENSVHMKMTSFPGGNVGDPHIAMDRLMSCEEFDLIWLLDYAHPSREREFFQILWVLEQRVPFVNKPSSIFFINNKIGVLGLKAGKYFASSSVVFEEQDVRDMIATSPETSWVLKPPNGGCGADVFFLRKGDPNFSSLIQSATGNAYQRYEIYTQEVHGRAEQYTVLQKFIPEMRQTENRVVISGGKIVGGYKKTSTGAEFRGNFALGGRQTAMEISDDARQLCLEIGRELAEFGIHYVGIDLAYPFIVEYNIVNPGGISGQLNATGEDIGIPACQAALEAAIPRLSPPS